VKELAGEKLIGEKFGRRGGRREELGQGVIGEELGWGFVGEKLL
jgi:hypothetical protein